MISPHGSKILNPLYVKDAKLRLALELEAQELPSITVCSQAAANAVMLGSGYFNPLTGYMNLADSMRVAEKMQTVSGLFWPVPVINMVTEDMADLIGDADRIALRDPNVPGNPVIAIQDVQDIEQVSVDQMMYMAERIFRTLDQKHPGVANFTTVGNVLVSGPIQVLNFSYFDKEFPETFRTAYEIRDIIKKNGWEKVVAFQTRNPMHLAHEELCRMAWQQIPTDGILIHMLLGKLKPGDIPADVRDKCIRTMVEKYFPENTVEVTGYGYDMLYAGPREGVLHAVFRQNCGCTHFIIGRDHAGVGDYYGGFDAQTIFHEEVPEGAMEIQIFEADHTAWSKKLNKVVMMRDHPDHKKEDYVLLSGTKVREMLGKGERPPKEFSRPEVADILIGYYQSLQK